MAETVECGPSNYWIIYYTCKDRIAIWSMDISPSHDFMFGITVRASATPLIFFAAFNEYVDRWITNLLTLDSSQLSTIKPICSFIDFFFQQLASHLRNPQSN